MISELKIIKSAVHIYNKKYYIVTNLMYSSRALFSFVFF